MGLTGAGRQRRSACGCLFPWLLMCCRAWSTTAVNPLPRTQAARDIASTIASSANRVYLNAENLMLNLSDVQPSALKKA